MELRNQLDKTKNIDYLLKVGVHIKQGSTGLWAVRIDGTRGGELLHFGSGMFHELNQALDYIHNTLPNIKQLE